MAPPVVARAGKGLGWRMNRGPVPSAHKLLAARRGAAVPALPPLERATLLPYRGRRIDQGQAGACVAFATVRALELYFGANGLPAVLASPAQLYYDGRREEWAGQDPDTVPALEDTGTEPRLMMTALEAEGFVPWAAYPYTDDPIAINREPPPAVYAQAYGQRGLRWGTIGDSGAARGARAAEALRARMPVTFGLHVDEAFLRNSGERVTVIDGHRLVGGHMLAVLAVLDGDLADEYRARLGLPKDTQPGDVLFDNWWGNGAEWGTPDGFGVLSGSLFGSLWLDDVTVFEAVPPVAKAIA